VADLDLYRGALLVAGHDEPFLAEIGIHLGWTWWTRAPALAPGPHYGAPVRRYLVHR